MPKLPHRRLRPQYTDVVKFLAPRLRNLPPILIAIDGWTGVGKTTLGRYLAWRFNVTLLETDLYLRRRGTLAHRDKEIARLIASRLSEGREGARRPIIVEGTAVLRLLARIGRQPDFLVYVANSLVDDAGHLTDDLIAYDLEWRPREKANVAIIVDW